MLRLDKANDNIVELSPRRGVSLLNPYRERFFYSCLLTKCKCYVATLSIQSCNIPKVKQKLVVSPTASIIILYSPTSIIWPHSLSLFRVTNAHLHSRFMQNFNPHNPICTTFTCPQVAGCLILAWTMSPPRHSLLRAGWFNSDTECDSVGQECNVCSGSWAIYTYEIKTSAVMMLTARPMMVIRLGAIHSGVLLTSQHHHGWM